MLHCMFNFPENKGDSRKLRKVQELVQNFSEEYRHYVQKQNISIDESLINYEKSKVKKKNCEVTNVYIHLMFAMNVFWTYVVCRAMLGQISYKKDIMDECICFSYFYP